MGAPSGQYGELDAVLAQQLQTISIEHVESLHLLARLAQVNPAIGHDTVDIEYRQPYGSSAISKSRGHSGACSTRFGHIANLK
jgi:hypothetical protein